VEDLKEKMEHFVIRFAELIQSKKSNPDEYNDLFEKTLRAMVRYDWKDENPLELADRLFDSWR